MDVPFELEDWAWARAGESDQNPDVSRFRVTAILVTRNGEAWLPAALESLEQLSLRPERLVAVDNGSVDETRRILDRAWANGTLSAVYTGDPEWSFGQAVQHALAAENEPGLLVSRGLPLGYAERPVEDIPDEEWLWFLHDDIQATPDVLRQLLLQVALDPQIALTGPTLLRPARRGQAPRIEELGVSISDTGRRELHLEPGEIEQGQHEPSPTLGLSTCGMLVRRNVFLALGGFDEAVPLHRDGVEFGWRANLAGFRVRTCPRAMLIHRSAGRAGVRDGLSTSRGHTPDSLSRLLGMRVVAAHRHGVRALLSTLRLVFGCLLRALGFLLGKAPDRSLDELRAAWEFVADRGPTARLRQRVAELDADPQARARVRPLRPPTWSSWRTGWESVSRAFQDWAVRHESADELSIDDLTGDEFAASRESAPSLSKPLVFVGLLLLAAVISMRGLIGVGTLHSLELLPSPGDVGKAFADYLYQPAGQALGGVPWLGLAALGSIPGITPDVAATLFVLLAVPLTTLAAHRFLRSRFSDNRLAWLGAGMYALLPTLAGGINRGALWLHAWTMLLALFAGALAWWARRPARGPDSWQGPAEAALWLTLLAALLPATWLAAVLGALALLPRARGRRLRGLVALLVPVLLLANWLPSLARHPGRLFTGPDPLLATLAPHEVWELPFLRTPGPGLPPLWLSLVVVGALWAFALLLTPRRPGAVAVPWLVALAALGTGVFASRLLVLLPGGVARPAVTPWLVLSVAAVLLVGLLGLEGISVQLAERDFGLPQLATLAAAALGAVAVVSAAGWWVYGGASGPIARGDSSALPAFVRQAQSDERQARTLAIDLSGASARWMLLQAGQPTWGSAESGLVLGGDLGARDQLAQYVAQIASGSPDEALGDRLAVFGVAYLYVDRPRPELVGALNAVPGLLQGVQEGSALVWVLAAHPTRAQVVGPGPAIVIGPDGQVPAAGDPQRRLVLAEPKDRRWKATLDGRPLTATDSGDWRQAFALGADGGRVRWELAQTSSLAWLQLLGLVVLVVLATPSIGRDEEVGVARRAGLDGGGEE